MVLGKKGGKATEAVMLRDVAQVLPRGGRTVVVMVGEEEVSLILSLHLTSSETSYGWL